MIGHHAVVRAPSTILPWLHNFMSQWYIHSTICIGRVPCDVGAYLCAVAMTVTSGVFDN